MEVARNGGNMVQDKTSPWNVRIIPWSTNFKELKCDLQTTRSAKYMQFQCIIVIKMPKKLIYLHASNVEKQDGNDVR